MRFESSQVKAPPPSRGRMRPPTAVQNSNSSFGEEQGRFEVGDQMWSARERTIITRTKQYLERRKKYKRWKLKNWKLCWAQRRLDFDFKRILEEATDEKGCAIFETFSTDGPSDFLVVSRGERTVATKIRLLLQVNGWWQEGLEEQRVGWMELGGKKGSGKLSGEIASP